MKLKRILAVAMATTMVMAMSMTAFAEVETSTPSDGTSTGAGASEGHVEKKATNVVLPTVATDGDGTVSPYRYTMDPERLISNTNHGKYDNVIYPATADDKGVYFNNGKKGGDQADKDYIVYTNTSDSQKVTNKSSHDIALTVTAEAVSADTDIPLVAQTALGSATDASLYLGLVVGSGESATKTAIAKDTAATKTVTLAGTEANFKVAAKSDKSGYEYRVLTLDEYKALEGNSSKTEIDNWKDITFAIEGECTANKAITATTTAPKLKVTWSWTDPTADTAPTITNASRVLGQNWDYTATFTKGTALALSATGLTKCQWASTINGTYADSTNITVNNGTATIAAGNWGGASNGDSRFLKVTIGGEDYIIKVTVVAN